eukprot:709065-Lingulodinium_polyedra.AAC.1
MEILFDHEESPLLLELVGSIPFAPAQPAASPPLVDPLDRLLRHVEVSRQMTEGLLGREDEFANIAPNSALFASSALPSSCAAR